MYYNVMPTVRRTRKAKVPSPKHTHSESSSPVSNCPACALEAAESNAQQKYLSLPKIIRHFTQSPRSKSEKARNKAMSIMSQGKYSTAAQNHLDYCERIGTYEDGTPKHKGCPRAPTRESASGGRRRRRKTRKSRKSIRSRRSRRRVR